MTEKTRKRRKLTHEILGLVCLCFALSFLLYVFITTFGGLLIEEYCFQNDIIMDEFDWYDVHNTLRGVGFGVSAVFFTVLFLLCSVSGWLTFARSRRAWTSSVMETMVNR